MLCFQEMETTEENFQKLEAFGYRLADYSNSFMRFGKIFGLATFYKESSLTFIESSSFSLPRSYYEIMLFILNGVYHPRTVLKTDFVLKSDKRKLTIYNLHLSPWATNSARDKQIHKTFSDMQIFNKKHLLIAGDFNYPYGRKKFESFIQEYGLHEATNNLLFTLEQSFLKFFTVKLKLDYILYKNFEVVETRRIPINYSDHFPIVSDFKFIE